MQHHMNDLMLSDGSIPTEDSAEEALASLYQKCRMRARAFLADDPQGPTSTLYGGRPPGRDNANIGCSNASNHGIEYGRDGEYFAKP